jgi:hypothetical protein
MTSVVTDNSNDYKEKSEALTPSRSATKKNDVNNNMDKEVVFEDNMDEEVAFDEDRHNEETKETLKQMDDELKEKLRQIREEYKQKKAAYKTNRSKELKELKAPKKPVIKLWRKLRNTAERPKGSGKYPTKPFWRIASHTLNEEQKEEWLDIWALSEKKPTKETQTFGKEIVNQLQM